MLFRGNEKSKAWKRNIILRERNIILREKENNARGTKCMSCDRDTVKPVLNGHPGEAQKLAA